jgi:spore maturation protein CgeB
MYEVLAASKIAINHHGNVPPFANNYRLFEATGMGALLITDYKDNLQDMFEVGKEIVAYRSIDECIEMVQYYLGHEAERANIAHAGQQRTLREHTFRQRMEELCQMISRGS